MPWKNCNEYSRTAFSSKRTQQSIVPSAVKQKARLYSNSSS